MLTLQKDLDRFWSKVNKTETCWLWTAGRSGGYGMFSFQNTNHGAHVISYQLHNKDYDKAKLVCHKCDTPACVNPSHLFLGSDQDNTNDKIRKGRQNDSAKGQKGEQHYRTTLTKADVINIKKRLREGEKARFIVIDYPNVSARTIWGIKSGKNWKDT